MSTPTEAQLIQMARQVLAADEGLRFQVFMRLTMRTGMPPNQCAQAVLELARRPHPLDTP